MTVAEALVTTAAGIVVAIEAVVVYNYFMARLGRIALELRLMTEEFVELLRDIPGVLQRFDKDKDGKLDAAELAEAIATLRGR